MKYGRFSLVLSQVLKKYEVDRSWPVVGQFSSIGSLGAQPTQWLTTEWSNSLAGYGSRGIRLASHRIVNSFHSSILVIYQH